MLGWVCVGGGGEVGFTCIPLVESPKSERSRSRGQTEVSLLDFQVWVGYRNNTKKVKSVSKSGNSFSWFAIQYPMARGSREFRGGELYRHVWLQRVLFI